MAAPFDAELDLVIEALEHGTRRQLMAFYVSEATSPREIAEELKIELPAVAYHTQILLGADAIENAAHQTYAATEVGNMAYVKVTGEPDEALA
jgi:hypothetical protein